MKNGVSAGDELIRRARMGDTELLGKLLEEYRADLENRAQRQLDELVGKRVGASDIVQQSFLKAFRAFVEFEGLSRPEFVAWLQRILERELAQTVRKHKLAEKRAIAREQSMQPATDDSEVVHWEPSAAQSSPSQRAIRNEDALRMMHVLHLLPPDQAEAVGLRYLEGWSLSEIAERMNRTKVAAAGLIKRGLQGLRDKLQEDSVS